MRELYEGIERERTQLRSIVQALPQAVLVLDAQDCIRADNPAACQLLGRAAHHGVAVDDHVLFEVRGRRTPFRELPGRTPDGVITVVSEGGAPVPVEVQQAPLEDGLLLTLSDLRNRLRDQAQLQEARMNAEVAQRAERARGRFLARMSHELRTPLNAIIGYSELLQDDLADPRRLADVARIQSAGTHLLALINDILDLSKVDEGHVELEEEDVSLDSVLVDVRDTLQPLARERGTVLRVSAPVEDVRVDQGKLKQCLFNLAGNAIRYTDHGRVTMRATIDGSEMRIDVEDTGTGIAPEALATLFEPFQQAAGARGGTGLGLSLVKALAERMGGRCTVTSTVGEGSCFSLFLPTDGAPPGL